MLCRIKQSTLLAMLLLASGCASLLPNFQQPEVRLVSFAPVQSTVFEPRFKLGLRIINPNSAPLVLKGMSYHLSLNDHKVVSGVSADIPEVPGYGEERVDIEVSPSLLGGFQFIRELFQDSSQQVDYKFQARLDVGTFVPAITITETGRISLGQ